MCIDDNNRLRRKDISKMRTTVRAMTCYKISRKLVTSKFVKFYKSATSGKSMVTFRCCNSISQVKGFSYVIVEKAILCIVSLVEWNGWKNYIINEILFWIHTEYNIAQVLLFKLHWKKKILRFLSERRKLLHFTFDSCKIHSHLYNFLKSNFSPGFPLNINFRIFVLHSGIHQAVCFGFFFGILWKCNNSLLLYYYLLFTTTTYRLCQNKKSP